MREWISIFWLAKAGPGFHGTHTEAPFTADRSKRREFEQKVAKETKGDLGLGSGRRRLVDSNLLWMGERAEKPPVREALKAATESLSENLCVGHNQRQRWK
jgi:hypothetical protein